MMSVYDERKQKLREIMVKRDLDGLLLYSSYHDARFSMWLGGVQPLLFHYFYMSLEDSGFLEIDYLTDIIKTKTSEKIIAVEEEDEFNKAIEKIFHHNKAIGVTGQVPHSHVEGLRSKVVDISADIEPLLLTKSKAEVEGIKRSAEVLVEAFDVLTKKLRPGITEKELEVMSKNILLSRSDAFSFPPIITSGSSSDVKSILFATDKKIQREDVLIVDIGVIKDGFHSDASRCLFMTDSEESRAYEKLVEVHKEVISELKPRVKVKELVNLYKSGLDKVGLDSKTLEVEDLGHSIGFGLHEKPMIYRQKDAEYKLVEGMIFTLEPEIAYKKSRLRVEDMVYLSKKGPVIITE